MQRMIRFRAIALFGALLLAVTACNGLGDIYQPKELAGVLKND